MTAIQRRSPVSQDYSLGTRIETGEHYALLRHTLTLNPQGVALEFGTGSGTSTALIAEHMPVVSFGSQFGLPEKWRDEFGQGSFAYPVPNIENADIVEGWFDETLPEYDFGAVGPVGLIHCDADLYSSTSIALKYAGGCIQPGTYVLFDEFYNYPGCEEHEMRAWAEFLDSRPLLKWSAVGHSFEQVCFRIDE